jgi:hypothetical protein
MVIGMEVDKAQWEEVSKMGESCQGSNEVS